uniref:Uncharacterized protein n=1 Tax=Panagrolaimus sp. ES5 TaxID=591445 RepID=A0AC34GA41_9BILA
MLQCLLIQKIKSIVKNSEIEDVPSQCYHPDLLQQEEYLALKKQFKDEIDKISQVRQIPVEVEDVSEEDKKYLLKTKKQIFDVLLVLESQKNLRSLCLIKKTFGWITTCTPWISEIKKNEKEEESEVNKDTNDIDENTNVERNFENDDALSTASVETFEVVDKNAPPSDSQYPSALKTSDSKVVKTKHASEANESKFDEVKKELKILKIQYAKIQDENETLKKSMEQILESQNIL